MRAAGGAGAPVAFGRTALIPHDSLVWKTVADGLLNANGVQVLYHAALADVIPSVPGIVKTLILHCKEGFVAVEPRSVVDASGDAEVVHRSGAATSYGRGGVVQTPTMIFRMGGVEMKRFLQVDSREIDRRVAEGHRSGAYRLPRHHVYLFPLPQGNDVLCNMTRITFPDGSVPSGMRSADLTFAEIEGRIQAREYARFLRENIPGFASAHLIDTGTQVGIRQSRSIVGQVCLSNEQVRKAVKVPGPATFSAWPIEDHQAGAVSIVYLDEQTYDIPFECLIPHEGGNVLAAGRCLCAEHEALASARVTAQCFGMGYAAGAACGLIVREGQTAQSLTGRSVADWMRQHGLNRADQR